MYILKSHEGYKILQLIEENITLTADSFLFKRNNK